MKRGAILLLTVVLVLALVVVPAYAKRGNGNAHKDNPNRKAGNALPDQDGKGMDRGLPSSDKEEDGGDWDNGCGNESNPDDREDDNNGRCGRPKSTATPTPAVTVTPVPTPTPVPTDEPTITVCWEGETPEVWDEKGKFLDESQLMAEAHDEICWTAEQGRTYFILEWTELFGHAGGWYSVEVMRGTPPGVYYPQRGDLPYLDLSE
ncbi:MAG: hypothetical protein GWN93_05980 [Deltaproteobacteria bacterium]|nr:hypothetical protein [Deltaproteobacteria bacterium]